MVCVCPRDDGRNPAKSSPGKWLGEDSSCVNRRETPRLLANAHSWWTGRGPTSIIQRLDTLMVIDPGAAQLS
jgi:hypothetical protein